MKILNTTKEKEAIKQPKHSCEFCKREFLRESTILKHICEYKQRWLNKDMQGNRIGFQAWLQFYKKNSTGKKNKTFEEFIRSAYYTAFIKFGNYCVQINCINVSRFADWLVKNQIKIDSWCTDTNYTKFLIEYLRLEDPLDAIARSIEAAIELSEIETIQSKDVLRYANKNRVCYAVTTGKISPWMLYQSKSGVEFLSSLDSTQEKLIMDYINPEQWAIKFKRIPDKVIEVKELLSAAGY